MIAAEDNVTVIRMRDAHLRVHATDCRDVQRDIRAGGESYIWTVRDREQLALEIASDWFADLDGVASDYLDEITVLPCVLERWEQS